MTEPMALDAKALEASRLIADALAKASPVLGGPEGDSILAYSIPSGLWLMLQASVRNLLDKLAALPPPAAGAGLEPVDLRHAIWDAVEARIDTAPGDGMSAEGVYSEIVYHEQRAFRDGLRSARLTAMNAVSDQPTPAAGAGLEPYIDDGDDMPIVARAEHLYYIAVSAPTRTAAVDRIIGAIAHLYPPATPAARAAVLEQAAQVAEAYGDVDPEVGDWIASKIRALKEKT